MDPSIPVVLPSSEILAAMESQLRQARLVEILAGVSPNALAEALYATGNVNKETISMLASIGCDVSYFD